MGGWQKDFGVSRRILFLPSHVCAISCVAVSWCLARLAGWQLSPSAHGGKGIILHTFRHPAAQTPKYRPLVGGLFKRPLRGPERLGRGSQHASMPDAADGEPVAAAEPSPAEAQGGAFLISRLVGPLSQDLGPRPPPNRKQKQRAAGAKLCSNHFKTGGFPCILATQATAQPSPYPI